MLIIFRVLSDLIVLSDLKVLFKVIKATVFQ